MTDDKVYVTIGASERSRTGARQKKDDYYATPPIATRLLLDEEAFSPIVLEPMCGGGAIATILIERGYEVVAEDKNDYGYGVTNKDFFDRKKWNGDIIFNPPYNHALKFTQHALKIIPDGNKVAFFLKLTFLEGQARKKFFLENPPRYVYVCSSRMSCAKNGDFGKYGDAIANAWFVW